METNKWQKIKEIFHDVTEVPDVDRENYVRVQSGGDIAVFNEVMSLIAAHAESEAFFESPGIASVKDLMEKSARPSRIGSIVGAYRIEREIGRGGMGAVFFASRADEQFDKKVAVKLIKRGFDTDEIIRRFRHERQILARLEHPYITRLIDGGATDDGLPYLVMDYVEGKRLTSFADEKQLSVAERLELFLKICTAVAYAHQNLVIHRDLKPSNILVAADGTPKLLDFGIAKLTLTEDGTANAGQTNTIAPAMTPEYASPEQMNGMPVTTSSDIYSLGVVLYELLTGYRPFDTTTGTTDELSRKITKTSPTKPSSVCRFKGIAITVGNPQQAILKLQGDLDNIVLMAIRNEPERRYSSVEQFAEDIRRFLAGRPVIAQEDTFAYRAGKFIQRNKAGVAAVAGVAVSLVGGLVASSRQAKIASRQRDRAQKEALKAEKINGFLRRMLASADPRVGGKDVKVIDVLALAARSIDSDFDNQPDLAADLESTLGLTYLGLGQLESAEHHLKAALEKHLRVFPRGSRQVAVDLSNLGKLLHAKGDLAAAEPHYLEALGILRKIAPHSLEIAELMNNLGYLCTIKGEPRLALKLHDEELDIRRTHFGENHAEVAKTLERIGGVMMVFDDRLRAESILRRSMRIFQNVHGAEHPDIALSMINLAGAIIESDPVEAEELCRLSLAMRRKLLGDDHVDVVWSLYNLAYVLINRKKLAEAGECVETALAKRGVNLPSEHTVVSSLLLLRGRVFLETGRFAEAQEAFEECHFLRQKTLPADHWLLASTLNFLGECLIKLGSKNRGIRMMSESFRSLVEKLGPNHTQTRQAAERMKRLGLHPSTR